MTKRAVIITTSIIVGIITTLTILFGVVFRVRDIKMVYGEEFCYKAQVTEILTASKLKKNSSIFSINREKIASNIEQNYPYARAKVNISSLTSVKIDLSNREPMYYFVQEGVYFVLDEDCKVLEVTTDSALATKYIKLDNVFDASETTVAGQFMNNKYTSVCSDLYIALYTNATVEVEDTESGEYVQQYLDRKDMYEIITSLKFSQVDELNGRVDRLNLTTSYGIKINIIEPQKDLAYKINSAFSALRTLQARDRQNGSTLIQSGAINIEYTYDTNNNQNIICEYRTN